MHFRSAIAVLAVLITAGLSPWPASAELRIGVSLPLSGNAITLAEQFLIGAQLAVEDHNRGDGEKARLIIADDGCDEALSGLAAAELKAGDPHIVTGLLCNEAAYRMADAFRESGIPVLVAGARSARITKDREREEWNIWRISPDDAAPARAAAGFLAERWAGEPYAVVDDGTVHGRLLADEFRAAMEAEDLPPQFQDTFRPTQSTQARLVRRLARAGTANVFIGAAPEDISMIARNAEEIDIALRIAGGEGLDILPFLDPEEMPPPGLLAVLRDPLDPALLQERFAERLGARGTLPHDHVFLGYQALEVALAALGDDPAPAAVTRRLRQNTFDTIYGPAEFGDDGSNRISPYGLYEWQGFSFKRIE